MKSLHLKLAFASSLLLSIPICLLHAQEKETLRDRDVKLIDFAEMEYPGLARTALVQGIVVIQAKLDDKGNVVDAAALSGADTLVPASVENARKWHFQPNPQKSIFLVYNFRVTSALSKSGCSHFTVEPPNFATITTCAPVIQ
jgi:hypothetical protein